MKHTHKFVAIPITGKGAFDGREALFGYRCECEQCHKRAKVGDVIVEVKQSWWKDVFPKAIQINYVLTDGK